MRWVHCMQDLECASLLRRWLGCIAQCTCTCTVAVGALATYPGGGVFVEAEQRRLLAEVRGASGVSCLVSSRLVLGSLVLSCLASEQPSSPVSSRLSSRHHAHRPPSHRY